MEQRLVIAIFEHDPADRFIFQSMLSSNPTLECLVFDSLEQGLAMAESVHFDVVLIDVHYQKANSGLDILKKLQEILSKDFVAIAVSPFFQPGDLKLIMSAGFSLCIEKPIIKQKFDALVSAHDRT